MTCGYKSLITQGIHFVSRQRSNATYGVTERRAVSETSAIIRDSVIRFNSLRSQQKQLSEVRQVVYFDAETNKQYTFLTNHSKLSAQTIADIYKQRWQVELFFK